MNEPCNRLMKARRVAGFRSARAAAAALSAKPATYAAHENGSRTFSVVDAVRYAEFYNVSPGWILTGEHLNDGQHAKVSDQTPYELVSSQKSPGAGVPIDAAEPLSHSAIYNFGKQALELLGRIEPAPEIEQTDQGISVGEVIIPLLIDEDHDPNAEQWEIVAQWMFPLKYYADVLKVTPLDVALLAMAHDNMSPTYQVGDRLIMDFKQKTVTIDGVYMFKDSDGKMHVQRIERNERNERNEAQLIISNDNPAENNNHPARTVDESELEIVGRVCGIIAAR